MKPSMPAPQTSTITTAQDLLNDVMGMGSSNRRSNVHPTQASSSLQPTFLFGSELTRGPSQSIWSAAQDEPLIYAGNGTTSVGFNGHHSVNGSIGANLSNSLPTGGKFQTTSPGQVHLAHSFSASGDSQDIPVPHQSIWSASYGAPTTSPQRAVPFSISTFSQSSQAALSTVIPQFPLHSPHRREQSISGASLQLYPNQLDPFTYPSPVLQQPAVPHPDSSSAHFGSSVGHSGLQSLSFGQSAAANLTPSEVGQPFYNREASMYHYRQNSNQNSRPERGQFISSATSQNWGNG